MTVTEEPEFLSGKTCQCNFVVVSFGMNNNNNNKLLGL